MQCVAFWPGFSDSNNSSRGTTQYKQFQHLLTNCCDDFHAVTAAAESLSVELRAALHDCFLAFANSTKQASGLLPEQALEEDEGEGPSQQAEEEVQKPAVTDAKLLVLQSNCVHVRAVVVSNLLTR